MTDLDRLRDRAERGEDEAHGALAAALLDERDPARFDPFEALYWLERSKRPDARCRAGIMWLTGLGCRADPARGRERLDAAARAGHPQAALLLGYCLEHALGGPREPARATQALQQAARAELPGALACLGWRHETGHTLPRDPQAAAWYYRQAEAAGHPTSAERRAGLDVPATPSAPAAVAPDDQRSLSLAVTDPQCLAWRPRVFGFPRFVSEDECLLIVAAALPRLQPSRVVRSSGGEDRFAGRTSGEMAFVAPHKDPVIWNIEQRIACASLLPADNGEPLVILRYGPGDEYVTHTDYCDPAAPAAREFFRRGGQRVATFLIYLNDVAGGGETEFPVTGVRVVPRRRLGVLFWNVHPDRQVDPDSQHAGVPVTRGQKWLASKWIREYAPRSPRPKDPRYAVSS